MKGCTSFQIFSRYYSDFFQIYYLFPDKPSPLTSLHIPNGESNLKSENCSLYHTLSLPLSHFNKSLFVSYTHSLPTYTYLSL